MVETSVDRKKVPLYFGNLKKEGEKIDEKNTFDTQQINTIVLFVCIRCNRLLDTLK